jgi:hypothetical protein
LEPFENIEAQPVSGDPLHVYGEATWTFHDSVEIGSKTMSR